MVIACYVAALCIVDCYKSAADNGRQRLSRVPLDSRDQDKHVGKGQVRRDLRSGLPQEGRRSLRCGARADSGTSWGQVALSIWRKKAQECFDRLLCGCQVTNTRVLFFL